ncbi:MAG: GNAT family N-acetyltransferase [Thermotogota bacterium]
MEENITLEILSNNTIDILKPLWEELRDYHQQHSVHFAERFKNFTFETRKEGLLKKDALHLLTAKEGVSHIGYCISSIDQNEGNIESLYLKPDFRKLDLGKLLITESMKWLEEQAVDSISVTVAAGNESVLDFYRRFGFELSTLKMKTVINSTVKAKKL